MKKEKEKKSLLESLAANILALNPGAGTLDIFKAPAFPLPKKEKREAQKLFKLLQHASTLLNKAHREQDKQGRYVAEKEDYINALYLVEKIVQEKQA